MAVAATAFLVAAVGTAITGGTVLGFTGITAILISGAVAGGLSFITRALTPKPKIPSFSGGAESGRTLNVREPAVSRKIIYGRTRVGGAIVFMESTGNKNEFLHIVIAVAGHEIDGYEKVFFNDELVWDNGTFQENYADFVRLNFATGNQTTADSDLVSESSSWTADHKLLGTAYIYARLKYNQDQFPSGLPQITAVVRGKKVLDPRDGTTAFSQNPALCVNDYLTDVQYGLMESSTSVDQARLIIAANECDESVNITGGSHQRYRLDGLLDTASSRKDNVEEMLTAMAGKLIYSGGKYIIQAGSYVTPTVTIDEDSIVGPISIQTKQSRRTLYNGVKGLFVSEDDNYVAADYPPQISSSFQSDDGDPIYLDVPLPFTTNDKRAQRLAKLALLKSRQQTSIIIPVNMAGLKFKAGDNIKVTNARLGYSEKPFEVIGYGIDLGTDGQIIVNVEAIETAPEIFDFNVSDEKDFTSAGQLNIYNGLTTQPPTNLRVSDTTLVGNDGSIIASLLLEWDASQDAFVDRYEIQYQRFSQIDYGNITDQSTETTDFGLITTAQATLIDYGSVADTPSAGDPDYVSIFVGADTTNYVVPNVVPGQPYRIRIRAINQLGIRSGFLSVQGYTAGDTTAPAIPTNLGATGGIKSIILSWTNPTDVDFNFVKIFENTIDDFSSSTQIAVTSSDTFTRFGLDYNETRFYWVTAVDYTGNESGESASASATTLFVEPGDFGQAVDDLFTQAGLYGVTPVDTLPASGDFEGQLVLLKTDVELYEWNGSAWVTIIADVKDGSITATKIANGAIETPKLAANAVTAAKIAANTITADEIASNTITTGLIQAGAITADKVSFTTLSSVAAQIGQFSSAASGARLVIEDDKLSVFDSSGTLRVRIGNLA